MIDGATIATLNPLPGVQIVVTWNECLADFGFVEFGHDVPGYLVLERRGEDNEVVRYKSTRLHRTLNRAIKLHLQIHEAAQIVAKDAAAGIST